LASIQNDNSLKLEEMRRTVDEKLQSTLEQRLGDGFRIVSERLEQVHQGLGEMRTLASGVGDLKKVLMNIRARGNWGEVQVGTLLEQILTPDQYSMNVRTNPDSNERVEYAIKLPGKDSAGDPVWLPIDSKFPNQDYERLIQAAESGDAAGVSSHAAALEENICAEAEKIIGKYVNPPHTTDFAILFLPTEGLFAEILRRPGICERTLRQRIVLAGPTTLAALLSSLQMGFRTVAIEKRTAEVWEVLGAVKTEFSKFGNSLATVEKKLHEASNRLGDVRTRQRVLTRKLRDVQELPKADTERLLELGPISIAAVADDTFESGKDSDSETEIK
jgi:DNA recombination protein RmuC